MKKYYFKSVVAIVLVTVITVNSFLGNGSVAHAKVSDRPGINTDTKQDYKDNETKGSTWNSRNNSASDSKKSEKNKDKKWDNRKKYEKDVKSDVKSEKKVQKSKHRGSVSVGIKKFLLDITGISFGKKFLNVCSRLAGKGFCGIGKFMYNTKGQFLGSLQFAGGVIQLAAAIGLCSTGAGAILGIPMLLHAVADMAQGGSIYINAVLGKKVLSEVNFMEEAYKAVGGFIGNIVGGAEGGKIGKKIASGTFVVADLAMAFATPEGAAKLASKFKSVDSMADAMKIFGRMFGQSISSLGKKAKKSYSSLSGLVNSTWKNSQKLVGEVKKVGKTFAETWNNYPKDKRIALSSNGVGEIEKFVDKFTGTIRETSKKVRESADNVVDSVGRDGKAGNTVKGTGKTLLPTEVELNGAVSEWSRMQKSLAPSNRQAAKFNTGTVVYDAKSGQYYYGMNRRVQISGEKLNPTLSKMLPEKSLNDYKLGNCSEVDAVNQALNNGANMSDLYMYTINVNTRAAKGMCANCSYTFNGNVANVLSK